MQAVCHFKTAIVITIAMNKTMTMIPTITYFEFLRESFSRRSLSESDRLALMTGASTIYLPAFGLSCFAGSVFIVYVLSSCFTGGCLSLFISETYGLIL